MHEKSKRSRSEALGGGVRAPCHLSPRTSTAASGRGRARMGERGQVSVFSARLGSQASQSLGEAVVRGGERMVGGGHRHLSAVYPSVCLSSICLYLSSICLSSIFYLYLPICVSVYLPIIYLSLYHLPKNTDL